MRAMYHTPSSIHCLLVTMVVVGCAPSDVTETERVRVTIDAPLREEGLEDYPSVPLGDHRDVTVGYGEADPGTVTFEASSPGFVQLTPLPGPPTQLRIHGTAQTPVAGRITVKAKIGSDVVGESSQFAVCSHPASVEWSNVTLYDEYFEGIPHVGIAVMGRLRSDNPEPQPTDLVAVRTQELVSPIVSSSGSFKEDKIVFASKTGKPFLGHEPMMDLIVMRVTQVQELVVPGQATVNQLFIYRCSRCNMPHSGAVPHSGFDHVRELHQTVQESEGVLWIPLETSKNPAPVQYMPADEAYSTEAGVANDITGTVRVRVE